MSRKGNTRCAAGGLGELLRIEGVVKDNEVFQEGEVLLLREDLLHLLGILREAESAVGMAEDIAGLVRHRVGAAGHVGCADTEDPEVGDHPFLAVVRDQAYMVAPFHAEIQQPGAEALELGAELLERQRRPFAISRLAHQGGRIGKSTDHGPKGLYDCVFHHGLPLQRISAFYSDLKLKISIIPYCCDQEIFLRKVDAGSSSKTGASCRGRPRPA